MPATRPQDDTIDVRYDVEDMPPLREAVPLGLQHVLVMMASNVTIPVILAGVIGATTGQTAFLVQVALLVAGLTTLMQTIGFGRSRHGCRSCREPASGS